MIADCNESDIGIETDNYSASSNKVFLYLKSINCSHIDLRELERFIRKEFPLLPIRLNFEVFAALVVKIENLTLLQYSSGKVPTYLYNFKSVGSFAYKNYSMLQICIVGAKTIDSIKRSVQWILRTIKSAPMTLLR